MTELEIMVEEIKKTSSQTAINKVDELKVMTCMLNDKDFKFDIYQRGNGKVAEVCPHDEMVSLATEIICTGTGLDKNTSNHLASNMTFSKSEARKILDLNKEFIDVYMRTGRKYNLMQNESTEANIYTKDMGPSKKSIPDKDNPGTTKSITTSPYIKLVSQTRCPKYKGKIQDE